MPVLYIYIKFQVLTGSWLDTPSLALIHKQTCGAGSLQKRQVLKLRPKPPDVEDARFCTLQGSLFCEQDENRTWAFRDR